MAIKATIFKASLEISDLDRQYYCDHDLTIAQHPSGTDERLMVRLLAFALNVSEIDDQGPLEFARDMWDADEPCLWQKDLTGQIEHWIDVGQPDEKRILRACARASHVSVYSYGTSTPIWWSGLANRLSRVRNLTVWQVPAEASLMLARVAQRSMRLQVTVQDGAVWVGDGEQTVEITPQRLYGSPRPEQARR